MKARNIVAASLVAVGVMAHGAVARAAEIDARTVLVAFDRGTDAREARAVAARNGVAVQDRIEGTRFRVVSTSGVPAALVERRLERDADVAIAEPNHIRRASAVPNDPLLAKGRQGWVETVRLP